MAKGLSPSWPGVAVLRPLQSIAAAVGMRLFVGPVEQNGPEVPGEITPTMSAKLANLNDWSRRGRGGDGMTDEGFDAGGPRSRRS